MWYVIQVVTGQEKKTVDMCSIIAKEKLVYEFFVPETDRMKKYHGEWHKVRKPMFPGYVFINTQRIDELYEELKNVPKLTKILKTDDTITPISAGEEAFIRNLTNKQYVAEMSLGYIVGDKLVIEEGPLTGKEAMVKKIDRHKRIAVLAINMFGNSVDITMGLEILKKD